MPGASTGLELNVSYLHGTINLLLDARLRGDCYA
jgi:hypothetical protein